MTDSAGPGAAGGTDDRPGDTTAGHDAVEAKGHQDDLSTWVALFYDLVFVAATLIFTKGIEHVHPAAGAFWITCVFAAAWWIWYSTTVLADRLLPADIFHRLLLLFQMLLIVLMAMEARVSVEHDSTYLGIEFGLLLITVAILYFRGARGSGPGAQAAGRLAAVNTVAALCFFGGCLIGEPERLVAFVAGLGISVVGTGVFWHGRIVLSADDERHYVERMAAFTLIVCGEAFIENALAVSGATISTIDIASLVFEFILVFALFSSYFENIPSSGVNPRAFRQSSALHLILQICVAASAVSATKLIGHSLDQRIDDAEILRLTLPLVVFYVALSGLDACSRRRPIAPLAILHLATAAMVGAVGVLAWFVPWIHFAEALPMLGAVAVAQLLVAALLRSRTIVLEAEVLVSS